MEETPLLLANGYRWSFGGEASTPWAGLIERFPALEALPGARVLKSNHFRTVFHVPGGVLGAPLGVIAKVYRYTSRWDRLRYRFIRHRALQEWTALRRFAELGLPTARAVAVAEQREGGRLAGGGLIVTYLEGTRPLSEARVPLEEVGRLVRRLHDAGVWHRDLHAGNVLAGEKGELYLIDLHTCYFLRRLARWQRRDGLAKLCHSLRNAVPAEALERMLAAYGTGVLGGSAGDAAREIQKRVERIHRTRVRSRSKRCFLPSTQFCVSRGRHGVTYHLRKHSVESLEPLWFLEPSGDVLKRSKRGWVSVAELGGDLVCVKHRRYGWLESLQAVFESHSLRRAYGGGHALAVRGIPTPQVVALRELRRFGLVREAHLVTELVSDAAPLDEHLFRIYWGRKASAQDAREKHRLARALGAIVRSLHDAGLFPHDLSPQNVLVRRALLASNDRLPPVLIADLDHLYLWKPLSERGRRKNLAQVGNLPEGHVFLTDLLRGLKAYANGETAFISRAVVADLRRRILDEHWKVLEGACRSERASREGDER